MKGIKIIGNKIEMTIVGNTIRGEYVIKNDKIYMRAKTRYELAELIRNKEEIEKYIKKLIK